jgi:hypothetical protein
LTKPVRKYWRNCLPWLPTIAARLLLDGRKIEPYTIIIMRGIVWVRMAFSPEGTYCVKRGAGTINTEQFSHLRHSLWTSNLMTTGKNVDPLCILQDNMQFQMFIKYFIYIKLL